MQTAAELREMITAFLRKMDIPLPSTLKRRNRYSDLALAERVSSITKTWPFGRDEDPYDMTPKCVRIPSLA